MLVHEITFYAIAAAVVLHLIAVVVTEIHEGGSITSAMFTGRKILIAVLATLGSALLLVQVPIFARLLHLSPLHADDWLIAGLGGLVVGSLAAFLPGLRAKPI